MQTTHLETINDAFMENSNYEQFLFNKHEISGGAIYEFLEWIARQQVNSFISTFFYTFPLLYDHQKNDVFAVEVLVILHGGFDSCNTYSFNSRICKNQN